MSVKAKTVLFIVTLWPDSAAFGQDAFSQGPWEIEVHGGTVAANSSNESDLRLPPAGFTFAVSSGSTSTLISSWYFADGAALLNQVATQRSAQNRIVPIDA